MANAIICDRCGEVICGGVIPMFMRVKEKYQTNRMLASDCESESLYDLCEECASSFDKWFVAGQEVS